MRTRIIVATAFVAAIIINYPTASASARAQLPTIVHETATLNAQYWHVRYVATTTTTAPTTTTIVQPVTTTTAPVAESGGTLTGLPPFLACVAWRESRDTPTAVNPSSGAGGLFQFLPSTWSALGYPGLPENASVADQIAAAEQLYAEQGAAPWAGGSYSC
jgi:soluble lytic murein transglycosylase-like protein